MQSVFAQTARPGEIIVVDDCSPDDTVTVVQRIAATAPVPVRLIRLPKNTGGPAGPIEVGVRSAEGELIAVLDQDDIFLPQKLAREAAVLARHPDVRFVFAKSALFDQPAVSSQSQRLTAELSARGTAGDGFVAVPGELLLALFVAEGNIVVGFPGFMFRKSEAAAGPLLDPTLGIAADYDFLCRLCGGTAAFVDHIHYRRRVHGENLSLRHEVMAREAEVVRRRYRGDPRFRDLGPHAAALRQAYYDFAYQHRAAGRARAAAGWLTCSLRLWGPQARVLSSLVKLPFAAAQAGQTLARATQGGG